jgi:hypothetical protein
MAKETSGAKFSRKRSPQPSSTSKTSASMKQMQSSASYLVVNTEA